MPRDLPRGEIPDAAAPPHGCSFHPRCPRAFAPCGWEARDLRAMLERRWTRLGEDAMADEAPLIATVDDARPGDERLRLRPHGSLADLEQLFASMRADDPDDPLWKGIQDIFPEGDSLVITFRPGVDPGLLRTGAVDVACHLHDPRFASS